MQAKAGRRRSMHAKLQPKVRLWGWRSRELLQSLLIRACVRVSPTQPSARTLESEAGKGWSRLGAISRSRFPMPSQLRRRHLLLCLICILEIAISMGSPPPQSQVGCVLPLSAARERLKRRGRPAAVHISREEEEEGLKTGESPFTAWQ